MERLLCDTGSMCCSWKGCGDSASDSGHWKGGKWWRFSPSDVRYHSKSCEMQDSTGAWFLVDQMYASDNSVQEGVSWESGSTENALASFVICL